MTMLLHGRRTRLAAGEPPLRRAVRVAGRVQVGEGVTEAKALVRVRVRAEVSSQGKGQG